MYYFSAMIPMEETIQKDLGADNIKWGSNPSHTVVKLSSPVTTSDDIQALQTRKGAAFPGGAMLTF